MERRILTADELSAEVAKLNGWLVEGGGITKKLAFSNFADALAYINKVGKIADSADHHPDICLGWGYAELTLTTHDRGGVTDKDIAIAEQIDSIANRI